MHKIQILAAHGCIINAAKFLETADNTLIGKLLTDAPDLGRDRLQVLAFLSSTSIIPEKAVDDLILAYCTFADKLECRNDSWFKTCMRQIEMQHLNRGLASNDATRLLRLRPLDESALKFIGRIGTKADEFPGTDVDKITAVSFLLAHSFIPEHRQKDLLSLCYQKLMEISEENGVETWDDIRTVLDMLDHRIENPVTIDGKKHFVVFDSTSAEIPANDDTDTTSQSSDVPAASTIAENATDQDQSAAAAG